MKYKHSQEYVVNYIHRHLKKGHSLPDVLEHLKKHNVDHDTMYAALRKIHLVEQSAQQDDFDDFLTQKKGKKQNATFLSELTIYEYMLGTFLTGLFVLSLFSSAVVTILLLVAFLCVGFAYAGMKKWPEILLFIFAWVGFFTLLQYENPTIAGLFLFLFILLLAVLHFSRK